MKLGALAVKTSGCLRLRSVCDGRVAEIDFHESRVPARECRLGRLEISC
jgi:hypothetical protein